MNIKETISVRGIVFFVLLWKQAVRCNGLARGACRPMIAYESYALSS